MRSRSADLVRRGLLRADDLNHALARVAGLAEVDVVRFDVSPEALETLGLRQARLHEVMPLGMAQEKLFAASSTPTDENLRRQMGHLDGHSVSLVWASREAILTRLDLQESATALASKNAPPTAHAQAPGGRDAGEQAGPAGHGDAGVPGAGRDQRGRGPRGGRFGERVIGQGAWSRR